MKREMARMLLLDLEKHTDWRKILSLWVGFSRALYPSARTDLERLEMLGADWRFFRKSVRWDIVRALSARLQQI